MTKGTLWPNLEEAGSKNGENEIPVLVRGSDINLSVSAVAHKFILSNTPT